MEPCGSKSPFSTKALEIVLRGYQSPKYPEPAVCTLSKNLLLVMEMLFGHSLGRGLFFLFCFFDIAVIADTEIRDSGYDFGSGSTQHCWCSVNKRVWEWETKKNRGGKHEAKSGLAGTRCVGVLAGWLVDFTRSDQYFKVVL